jgi:hypothetical protein
MLEPRWLERDPWIAGNQQSKQTGCARAQALPRCPLNPRVGKQLFPDISGMALLSHFPTIWV